MKKKILITGATDGIGLETARALVSMGHHVLLHGRNPKKLQTVADELSSNGGCVEEYIADFSSLKDVENLATAILEKHESLDVLINNAGVFKVQDAITSDGMDVRFVVNTNAPYLLAKRLLPLLENSGRVVNLSSAAQAPVNLKALRGGVKLGDMEAYSQSKLALTMWSFKLAERLGQGGPAIIAVNPGSLLGSKMVKEAFGLPGGDLQVGADILCRAALSDEFDDVSGQYYDNDSRQFAPPHPDAMDPGKCTEVVQVIESMI